MPSLRKPGFQRGQCNFNARLTPDQVREIRALRAPYWHRRLPKDHPASVHAIAARFGISVPHVSRICTDYAVRRYWRDV